MVAGERRRPATSTLQCETSVPPWVEQLTALLYQPSRSVPGPPLTAPATGVRRMRSPRQWTGSLSLWRAVRQQLAQCPYCTTGRPPSQVLRATGHPRRRCRRFRLRAVKSCPPSGFLPSRAARVERARTHLRAPASWFLLANEGPALVGMASAEPLRDGDETGPVIPGGCSLHFLFVIPERWGEGIGGVILDAIPAEAKRRHYSRIHLWTNKDNERSARLYRSRGFAPAGRTEDGERECARDLTRAGDRPTTDDEEGRPHPGGFCCSDEEQPGFGPAGRDRSHSRDARTTACPKRC